MKKHIIVIFTVIVIILVFIFNIIKQKTSIIEDNKFHIVASFYPIYIAALNISDGIDNVDVKCLTSVNTGCLHNYTLLPEEMIAISKANILFINGGNMEEFLTGVVSNYKALKIVDTSESIEKINTKHNDTSETNPHFFASIEEHIIQVKNIEEELVNINPENAKKYKQNTQQYINKLNDLQKEINDIISNTKNKKIATFDNAFEYFAKDNGLKILISVETEHGTEPSAKILANAIKKIKEDKIHVMFAEPNLNVKISEILQKETEAKVYIIDPAASGKDDKNGYIDIMRKNISVLKQAFN